MSTQELKQEINKSLDEVPESVLREILSLLKQVENQSPERVDLSMRLSQILKEDKELLERLAQ